MKTVKDFFNQNYFSKDFPLEYRVYMIFFFELIFLSLLSATTNTLLGKGLLGVALQWTVLALCIVVLFIPVKARMSIQKPLLAFITLFYVPFLYFQTAGYDGTALLFAPLAIFMLAFIFKGKQRVAIIALNILIFVGCCVFEYLNPNVIVPHASALDKLVDLLVALVISTAGTAIVAVYIGRAYENEREHIKTLMNEDVLTGAYARRYLYEQLPLEMNLALRTKQPLSLLMFDLDHFKNINDTYGHSFGDEVLQKTAQAISQGLRPYDILARYGGEEFVVVLQGTPYTKALEVAARLHEDMKTLELSKDINVTISIGATELHADDTADSLIERADSYLYEAKESGRNRTSGAL